VLLAVTPDTDTDSDVLPFAVYDLKVAEPVAVPVESVSGAFNVVFWLVLFDASVPVSEPTVTTELAPIVVGKFAGSATWVPVGLLDRARDPAPDASVVTVPTTVPSIATLSVLFAVVPLTLTLKFVVAVPVEEVDFVTV
jgi:hypothetical protein